MSKSLFSIVTGTILLASVGFASAQTTTTTSTTWTADQGAAITTYSTSQKQTSFMDPTMKPTVGMTLPNTVTVYPLPETMKIMPADRYSYGVINERPVVVERTTRQVIHTW
jgi:hypothetical protein